MKQVGGQRRQREIADEAEVQSPVPYHRQWTPGGIKATPLPLKVGYMGTQAKVVKAMLRLFSHEATKADEANDEGPLRPPSAPRPASHRCGAGRQAKQLIR